MTLCQGNYVRIHYAAWQIQYLYARSQRPYSVAKLKNSGRDELDLRSITRQQIQTEQLSKHRSFMLTSVRQRPGPTRGLAWALSRLVEGDNLTVEVDFRARTSRSPRQGPSQRFLTAIESALTPEWCEYWL